MLKKQTLIFLAANVVFGYIIYTRHIAGTMHINTNDVEKDIYNLEVSDFNKLNTKRFVIIKINKV